MIWYYRLLFWPLFILMLPGALLRLARRGGKWHLGERFGLLKNVPQKREGVRRIWIQAVSVGELSAIKPILESLKSDPTVEVVLSTTTTTGYRYAEEKYKGLVSYLFTFPLDVFSACAWKKLNPDYSILMEGELWPEHLHQANKRGVKVAIINARLSDRSFRRLGNLRKYFAWVIRRVHLILAATKQDAERYIALGANPELVSVTGNLKFDAQAASPMSPEEKQSLLASLGWNSNHRILLGSSTWAGEETMLLKIFSEIKAEFPDLRLLLTPRHAERGNEVEEVVKKSGLSYSRRSKGVAATDNLVTLADTTGELARLTQLAEVVTVGKSFLPHSEGQSPVDAAASGKPIFFGPGMTNFAAIAAGLVHAQGAAWAAGEKDLKEQLLSLLRDSSLIKSRGECSKKFFEQNKGAAKRTLEWLELSQTQNQNARTAL